MESFENEASHFSFDAFEKGRVSLPTAQFEYANEYNKGPLVWVEKLVGTGSVEHQPNTSSVKLSTGGTASGAAVIRQTRDFWRYSAGESLAPILTFCFDQSGPNKRKRVGYFDGRNGVFLEELDGIVSATLRSKSSGTAVDTPAPQAQWNKNQLRSLVPNDGAPTLDWTKAQIFSMDVQWLGVGSVRVVFSYRGRNIFAHEFAHTNEVTAPYMTSANLPIRYEVENLGTITGENTLTQICSAVHTEQGGLDDKGFYRHGVGNKDALISVTTRRAILSIRQKTTFNGIECRGRLIPDRFEVTAQSQTIYWELVYGGTLGGSPSWASAGDNSIFEYDVAGTTVTGGEVVVSGYCVAGANQKDVVQQALHAMYPMGLDVDGANPPLMSLVCVSVSGVAAQCGGAMSAREYY